MRPSALLRSLSSKLLSSSPVTPWPSVRTAFDCWFTSELVSLRLDPTNRYDSFSFLSNVLDLTISAVLKATTNFIQQPMDQHFLDVYLDDNIILLDGCNTLKGRIESVRSYLVSLSVALHHLESAPNPTRTAIERARAALDQVRFNESEKCGSHFGRVRCEHDVNLHEELCGAHAMAYMAVTMAWSSVSFRFKQRAPTVVRSSMKASKSWVDSICEFQREVREDLEKRRGSGVTGGLEGLGVIVLGLRRLKGLISQERLGGEVTDAVQELRRRCGEWEERMGELEKKVDGLYRQLIEVRMCLLGMISKA